MVIRIGSISFIVSMFLGMQLYAAYENLQLQVINKNDDKPITKLALGVPYTLELRAEGAQDLYNCKIPGIENFHSEFCGASHLNLMSHVSTVHSYVLRADKLGAFNLGPVKIITPQGKTLLSNSITLVVEQEAQSDVLLHLVFAKTKIYAGQRMSGVIQFCTSNNAQLMNMQLPTIEPSLGSFAQAGQHTKSTKVIDGVTYDCFEIPVEMVLKKPGGYSLPKIGAYCRIPNKRQHSLFGFNLAMHGSQEQWFYSTDTVVIHVEPLPPCSSLVVGVGNFEKVSLKSNRTKASAGEGIVVTLNIIGKEGIHDALQPSLDLGSAFKYYESKSTIEQLAHGAFKKSCEYIVQGLQEGYFEIPPQIFTFFDTATGAYKQLRTEPLTFSITQGMQSVPSAHDHQESYGTVSVWHDDEIVPIQTNSPWYHVPERSFSLLWFIVLLFIPCVAMSFIMFKRYMKGLGPEYWIAQRKKYAFKETRKKLAQLKKSNNCTPLYDTFVELFAHRCQLSLANITADVIEQRLKNVGFVGDSLEQWNRFFLQLAENAYCQTKTNQTISDDLFRRAQMWINQLEEKL